MITFCTSEEFTLQIEGVGRTEYNIILTQEIGKDLPVDDIVTELSENPVKSSGIWSFVKNQIDTVKNWATNLFLKKSDEDKGSEAVEGHEQEYNHNAFLTSVPPIPSDISDLTDDGNLIPPHLFFDDQYFSGAGTALDPKSLRTENLPSGGGQKQVELTTTEQGVRDYSLTQWDDGTPINLKNGDAFEIYVDNMVGWGEDDSGYTKSKIHIHFGGLDGLRYIRDGLEERTWIQDPTSNSDAKFIHLIKFRIYGNRLVGRVFRKGSYSENFAYLFDVGHMDEIEEINGVVLRGNRISLGWNKGVRFIIRKI